MAQLFVTVLTRKQGTMASWWWWCSCVVNSHDVALLTLNSMVHLFLTPECHCDLLGLLHSNISAVVLLMHVLGLVV